MAFFEYDKDLNISPRFQLQPYDPSLNQAPVLPAIQPQGFFEKIKALNSGGQVMGQSPYDFAQLMGGIASSFVPVDSDYPSGRLGAQVAGFAKQKQQQFREDTSPERLLATARAQAALGEGNPMPTESSYASGARPTSLTLQDASNVASRLGQWDETARGPLTNQHLAAATGLTLAETGKTGAETSRIQSITPLEQEQMRYMNEHQRLMNEVDTASKGADIQNRLLQPQATQQQINASKANVGFEGARIGIQKQELGLRGAELGIRARELSLNEGVKNMAQVNGLTTNLQNHITTIGNDTSKILERTLPAKQGAVLANAGKTVIQNALNFAQSTMPYAHMDPNGSLRTVTANAIDSGIQYYVQGINGAVDNKTKMALTGQLIMTLDTIRKSQPAVADGLERQLFSSSASSPIAPGANSASWWQVWKNSDAFDPVVYYKIWRQTEQKRKGGKR